MSKKIIKKQEYLDDAYSFLDEKTLKDSIKYLKELVKKYGNNAKLDYVCADYGDSIYYNIIWEREENDEEYKARIHREEKAKERKEQGKLTRKQKKEASDIKEYERLKKKFGDK